MSKGTQQQTNEVLPRFLYLEVIVGQLFHVCRTRITPPNIIAHTFRQELPAEHRILHGLSMEPTLLLDGARVADHL